MDVNKDNFCILFEHVWCEVKFLKFKKQEVKKTSVH